MTTTIHHKISQLLGKAKEQAGLEVPVDFDVAEMSNDEIIATATVARLHRLLDADYERILADHLKGITNVVSADKAIDTYTQDYLLDLPLSYEKLSQLADTLAAAVKKYKITPPKVWTDMAAGDFPFKLEIEYLEQGVK